MAKPIDPQVWEGILEMIAERLPKEVGDEVLRRLRQVGKDEEEIERLNRGMLIAKSDVETLRGRMRDQKELEQLEELQRELTTKLTIREEVLKVKEAYCLQHVSSMERLIETLFRGPIMEARIQRQPVTQDDVARGRADRIIEGD